jgi:hypothetical protein
MEISEDTQRVIDFLIDYSESTLRKTNDLAIILETAATHSLVDNLAELILSACSVYNLRLTIKKQADSPSEALKKEMLKSYQFALDSIKKICEYFDEQSADRFNRTYLTGGDGALMNFIDLAYDFTVFKAAQNDLKNTK